MIVGPLSLLEFLAVPAALGLLLLVTFGRGT